MEGEVSAPGMAHQVGGVPAELIEDRHDVTDRLRDGEFTLGRRGRQPALLEGCDPVTRTDFIHHLVQVVGLWAITLSRPAVRNVDRHVSSSITLTPSASRFDESRADRISGQLDTVAHAELAQNVGPVSLHGLEGDVEVARYLA